MAVYRFRVTFEDYDDIVREIDVKSNQTFQDLHHAIHKSTGYNPDYSSSFYISNDQWTKGEEITFMPNQRKIDRGIALMDKVKLSSFIDDPHQKFYYTFNFDRPFDFHVELMKIILDESPKAEYPQVVRSVGEAPKQFGNVFNPTILPPTSEEFDFLNEMEYNPEDTEDFTEVDETGEAVVDEEEEAAEEDEFGSEFSDNEGFEEDDRGRGSRDDY
ncbi:plasmid pRiA4b ORF-3 family protein [Mucilaginibacter sp. UR6-1]|uniref:plasmid pRiA4b ORF-3 family protein n=1 Tax=Mucilaginibacter sp. UR6-1 TaxID=1435643 RepID=UPI001E35DD54|nr:plasmid pRiA4b ORF-3 family protein [Mucilaginibacter sp. UR6-1]MCC8408873.1 plasmid pRiA4b ORF-3 family protein [Mucilaginibacter sp. UR6-1]